MKNIYITTLLLLGLIGSLYANANDQHPSFFESAVYNQLDGNMKMAEIYYEESAKNGNRYAAYSLSGIYAQKYKKSDNIEDMQKSVNYIKLAANLGHSRSSHRYGLLHYNNGNFKEAMFYLELGRTSSLNENERDVTYKKINELSKLLKKEEINEIKMSAHIHSTKYPK